MTESKKVRWCSPVEIERMKTLYDENWSLSEIAAEFSVTPGCVAGIFRRHNVTVRSYTLSRKRLEAGQQRRLPVDQEELRGLYSEQELSTREIAKRLGISQDTVRRDLKRYNIPLRASDQVQLIDFPPELLRRLFIEERLTVAAIAARLGFSQSTIKRALVRHDIRKNSRSSRDGRTVTPRHATAAAAESENPDSALLERRSSRDALTVAETARRFGISEGTVYNLIKRRVFANSYRHGTGKESRWLIPSEDLENFIPRGRGGVRRAEEAPLKTVSARARYARARLRQLYGIGQTQLNEMTRFAREGLKSDEIAARFQVRERLVADVLSNSLVRQPYGGKKSTVIRDWRSFSKRRLTELYVDGEFSIPLILAQLRTNRTTLYIGLIYHKLPLREEPLLLSATENKEIFRCLSEWQGLSPAVIAERLNLTVAYVNQKVKALDPDFSERSRRGERRQIG